MAYDAPHVSAPYDNCERIGMAEMKNGPRDFSGLSALIYIPIGPLSSAPEQYRHECSSAAVSQLVISKYPVLTKTRHRAYHSEPLSKQPLRGTARARARLPPQPTPPRRSQGLGPAPWRPQTMSKNLPIRKNLPISKTLPMH